MKVKLFAVMTLAFALLLSACGKSDADLQKAAADKLAADKITGVTVAVNDGVASLTGMVDDITVKSRAEASVKGVEGIKSVNSTGVTLKPLPTPPPVASDQNLTGKITEDLKKAGCDGATVTVVNGKPTVTGEVPAAKYAPCIQVIQQSGVTGGVDNQLKKGK